MIERLPIQLKGIGCSVPDRVFTNADFEKVIETTDEWIQTRSGIRERRFVSEGENTLTLATGAAQKAIVEAGMTPDDIDLIIVATSTPYTTLPSTACWLQAELGCRQIPAFDIAAACSGFIYAMVTASCMMGHTAVSVGLKNALVVGAETMSTITDFQDRSTCVLLGDGAGAAVLSHADNDVSGIYDYLLGADGTGAKMIWTPAGGSKTPTSEQTVADRQHYLQMNGREVYRFAVKKFVEVLEGAIERAGIKAEDLAMVIPHQSNLRIIESAAQRLGMPMDRVAVNIDRYGNTSAASIPLALGESLASGKLKKDDWVLMAGFGAGLTWGTCLIRL